MNIKTSFYIIITFLISCQEPKKIKEQEMQFDLQPIDKLTITKKTEIPSVTEFNYPVGPPSGKGYYKAQEHGEINHTFGGNLHLGEDWNGTGGGNTDFGDTVYSIANGQINYSDDAGPGWGNVIKITHRIDESDSIYFIESLYGHLNQRFVKQDSIVQQGTPIGTIGNADGIYLAHLHLELRKGKYNSVGGGYIEKMDSLYLNPTKFIESHRLIIRDSI